MYRNMVLISSIIGNQSVMTEFEYPKDADPHPICQLISDYEFIFQNLTDGPLPCMDADWSLIDCKNYYGVDFSQNPVIQFFFTGSSPYFPAIIPLKGVPLEKCPIYIFDLAGGDKELSCSGNIRKYLSTLIHHFLDHVVLGIEEKLAKLDYEDNQDNQGVSKEDIQHAKELLIKLEDYPIEVLTPPHRITYRRSEDAEEVFVTDD